MVQSAIMAFTGERTLAPLPSPLFIKNTFICFDDVPTVSPLTRFKTCPEFFRPDRDSEDEDAWANASTDDEENPAYNPATVDHLATPKEAGEDDEKRHGDDLQSDEEEPLHSATSSQNGTMGALIRASKSGNCPKLLWADFSSDEEEKATRQQEHSEEAARCRPDLKQARRDRRKKPAFQRALRETRTRHIQNAMEEFCSLDFEEVDGAQQMGLTRRMLFLVKALADPVTFWEGEDQHREEAFRLLGLTDSDMLIIKGIIDEASQLIEAKCFSQANNKLCSLRPWFQSQGEDLEVQRQRLRELQEVQAEELEGAERDQAETITSEQASAEVNAVSEDQNAEAAESAEDASWVTVSRPARGAPEAQPDAAVSSQRRWSDVASAMKGNGAKAPLAPSSNQATVGQGAQGKGNGKEGKSKGKGKGKEGHEGKENQATGKGNGKGELLSDRKSSEKGDSKGKGKGKDKGKPVEPIQERQQTVQRPWANSRPSGGKLLCFFRVGIEEDAAFHVCRRLIGPHGEHMKHVVAEAGNSVKLRLRGHGSKFLEGLEKTEAAEPLMLCISAEDQNSFEIASALTEDLLAQVHADYRAFCQSRGLPVPALTIRREAGRGSA